MKRCWPLLLLLTLVFAAFAQEPRDSSKSKAEALVEVGMNAMTGAGPGRRDLEGVRLIRNAAELGYVPAQTVMGYLEEYGVLVPANRTSAAAWYEKAGDQGDRVAQWAAGRLYLTGGGPARDLTRAERWLKASAGQGDPFAAQLLGLLYEERDYTQAPGWFEKAAEQGLPFAQQKLAEALERGRGVTVDKRAAYVWYVIALENGNQAVSSRVAALEAELGQRATEEAKKEAREKQREYSRASQSHGCTGWEGELEMFPTVPPPKIQPLCR